VYWTNLELKGKRQ